MKDNPLENIGQMQSSFKEFEKKSNNDDTYFSFKESESPHYLRPISRNPPTPYFIKQISSKTPTKNDKKIKTNYIEIDIS